MPSQAKWPPPDPTTAPQHVQGCCQRERDETAGRAGFPRLWACCRHRLVGRLFSQSDDLEDMLASLGGALPHRAASADMQAGQDGEMPPPSAASATGRVQRGDSRECDEPDRPAGANEQATKRATVSEASLPGPTCWWYRGLGVGRGTPWSLIGPLLLRCERCAGGASRLRTAQQSHASHAPSSRHRKPIRRLVSRWPWGQLDGVCGDTAIHETLGEREGRGRSWPSSMGHGAERATASPDPQHGPLRQSCLPHLPMRLPCEP